MWKYIALDMNDTTISSVFEEDNKEYKASEVCSILELAGLEVISLKKVEPIEILNFLYKKPKLKQLIVAQ